MLSELRKHPGALLISLALHALVIGLMVLNLSFFDKLQDIKVGPVAKTVQAEVVDQKQLDAKEKQKQLEEKRKREAEKKQKDLEANKLADKKKTEAE